MIALLLNLGVMNGLKKPEFMSEIQARVTVKPGQAFPSLTN